MKVAFRSEFAHPLPEGHRFPMEKYSLLPQQLMYENTVEEDAFFRPELVDLQWVLAVHDPEYVEKLNGLQLSRREERRTGFPLSKALVDREMYIAQGTIDCCKYAFDHGVALNIAGGTHHAYPDHGEGFCLYNDQAIAANWLIQKKRAQKVLIVDLDVHQGNGTAFIFQNRPEVFTFSMHGSANYPMHKEHSDLDIPLEDQCGDGVYLKILHEVLPKLIEQEKPDFIFYQSGVDVLGEDKLGRLALTKEGCKERDYIVWEQCWKKNIPVVACMGGGYAPHIKVIIEAHANTYRTAKDIFG